MNRFSPDQTPSRPRVPSSAPIPSLPFSSARSQAPAPPPLLPYLSGGRRHLLSILLRPPASPSLPSVPPHPPPNRSAALPVSHGSDAAPASIRPSPPLHPSGRRRPSLPHLAGALFPISAAPNPTLTTSSLRRSKSTRIRHRRLSAEQPAPDPSKPPPTCKCSRVEKVRLASSVAASLSDSGRWLVYPVAPFGFASLRKKSEDSPLSNLIFL